MKDFFRTIHANLRSLIEFQILSKIVLATVIGPIFAFILTAIIHQTQNYAINNEGIAAFALSLPGICFLLLFAISTFVILFFEQAGLSVLMSGCLERQNVSAIHAVWKTCKSILRLIELAFWQVIIYLVLSLPVLAIAGSLYLIFLTDYDINYYVSEKPPVFIGIAIVTGILGTITLITLYYAYLRFSFSVPIVLDDGCRARTALKKSWSDTNLYWKSILGSLLKFAGGLFLVLIVVGLLIDYIEDWMLLSTESFQSLFIYVCLLLIVKGLLSLAVTLVVSVYHMYVIISAYRLTNLEKRAASSENQEVHEDEQPPQKFGILIYTTAFVLIIAAIGSSLLSIQSFTPERSVLITAHRGNSKVAPENTLSSIRAAIEAEADFAEIDVQLTKDKRVVVIHDKDLKRIANDPRKITDVTYEELTKIDAGGWFDPKFKGEPIPLLDEVLKTASGKIKLNIELKYDKNHEQLNQKTVEVIRKNNFDDQCILCSLDSVGLDLIRKKFPSYIIGQIVTVSIGSPEQMDVDFLSMQHSKMELSSIRSIHRAGKQIHVWTVNDPGRMQEVINLGVDNIITDDPALLKQARQEFEQMEPIQRAILGLRGWLAQ